VVVVETVADLDVYGDSGILSEDGTLDDVLLSPLGKLIYFSMNYN
jgi:hypothetical protein